MIAIVKGLIGITRLKHLLTSDPEISSGFPDGIVISFDPDARAAAHALGFKVLPEVIVERRITNQRREAANRLKKYKSSLLDKRRIARATARWSKPLGVGYQAIQATLQGRQTREIVRHSQALSAALEIAGSSTTVYVDGCVGALTVSQVGLSRDRLRVL